MTLTMVGGKRKERAYSEHKPKWQRFQSSLMAHSTQSAAASQKSSSNNNKATLHPYQRQYAHVYHQRLAALKPRCWQSVDADNDNNDNKDDSEIVRVERILDLEEGIRSIVVGTLVKEGSGGQKLHDQSRCLSDQTVFIEDESGRANLAVENAHEFATGMVLGLLGTVQPNGSFLVKQVYYPALPPHPPTTKSSNPQDSPPLTLGNPHLLLVSGLQCGDPSLAPAQRQMLLDYIRGSIGTTNDDDNRGGAKISHVIIAGGSTAKHDEHPTVALRELDGFCLQLGSMNVPVDILPGKEDPTTANWPQRPLHKSLLKYSDRKVPHLVSRVPNPYGAVHADKYILGTDGTNATDLAKSLLTKKSTEESEALSMSMSTDDSDVVKEEKDGSAKTAFEMEPVSHLEALRRTLQCSHICPTGPDTVPTMPHPEKDPMVLPDTPHLYFAGNCDEFDTDVVVDEKRDINCRLVCIPRFAETGEAVLVNLKTMETQVIRVEDPGV